MAECDRYGFFNGILGIEQSNWAQYWKGVIPDGIVAGVQNEMEVFAQSDGMKVHVRTGEAIIAGHRAWINQEKTIDIASNTSGNTRTDGIVLRVTYGNTGESKIEVLAKTGVTNPTKNIGSIYEMLLATVSVGNNAVTIPAGNVTDRRYVFKIAMDAANGFSGTSVTPLNDREYRNNSAISSLVINLPASQTSTSSFITGVCFKTAGTFNGVTFRKGGSALSNVKVVGDVLTLINRKYNLIIWWDGEFYWCASKAANL